MKQVECKLCNELCLVFSAPVIANAYHLCENCHKRYLDDVNDAVAEVNERWDYAMRNRDKHTTIDNVIEFAINNPDKVKHSGDRQTVSMPEGIYELQYHFKMDNC